MGSIQRQESFDSDGHRYPLYDPDDLEEARTLTCKEMQRAREEALYVLKTKSAEEAFKIFTQGLKYNVDNPVGPGELGDSVGRSAGNGRTQTQTTTAPPPQNSEREKTAAAVPDRVVASGVPFKDDE